jgi:amidase
MARSVEDAAILLDAIAGADPADPATASSLSRPTVEPVGRLDRRGLSGTRLGVARAIFGFHPEVDRVMEDALHAMKLDGAVLVDSVELSESREIGGNEMEVLLYEFKADLEVYLSRLPEGARIRSLADAIAFNEKNRSREMPYFGQELFVRAQEKGPLSEAAYLEALATCRRLAREEGIDRAMDAHGLDAIVAPTGGPAWTTDLVNGDHYGGGCSTLPAVAGYPHVTVPAGAVVGLPVGVSFFGRPWSEAKLLRIAHGFERAANARRVPRFLATVDALA